MRCSNFYVESNVAFYHGLFVSSIQGRNEVRWPPGARSNFGASMFEPEVFWKQLYCIEESVVTLLGLFGARINIQMRKPKRRCF